MLARGVLLFQRPASGSFFSEQSATLPAPSAPPQLPPLIYH